MEATDYMRINKMEAITLALKLVENNEINYAHRLLLIIDKSISREKTNNKFSEDLEVSNSSDIRFLNILLKRYSL